MTKKKEKKPPRPPKETPIDKSNLSEAEHGQAWERGESCEAAKDESGQEEE